MNEKFFQNFYKTIFCFDTVALFFSKYKKNKNSKLKKYLSHEHFFISFKIVENFRHIT